MNVDIKQLSAVASAAPYEVVVAVPSIGLLMQSELTGERLRQFQEEPLLQRIVQFLAGVFSQAA